MSDKVVGPDSENHTAPFFSKISEGGRGGLGGGHTRQQDDEVPPTQSRISPSVQRILRFMVRFSEKKIYSELHALI